jgi:spore coat protein CotH
MFRFFALRLVIVLLIAALPIVANCAHAAEDDRPLSTDDLFESQRLLDIRIEIAETDWKELSSQTLSFVTAFEKGAIPDSYTYFPANITIEGRQIGSVKLRKKGFFGSTDQDRPSLKVKIDGTDQSRMVAGLDKLTINNNKQDRAFVSQYLGYRLFQAAGLPAPRCSLAQVTVNGKSLGIYTHVESIDQPFLRRVFGNDSGNLYEGVFPTDFFADRLERFESKKTKKRDNDRSDLRRVAEILEKPGEDFVSQLAKVIDLDQFINYWALESLIGFWDGYAANQNNYYLYRDPEDLKFHFIPWGADMTMVPPFFPTGGNKSVYAKGQLAYQLNQDAATRQKYHQALLTLLDSVWREDDLLAQVDRIEKLVNGHLHPAQAGNEQSAETTRNFIRKRRSEIMEEIKNGPIHVTTRPAKPFYMREAGKASATFATAWTAKDTKDAAKSKQATFQLDLIGEPVKINQVVATAGPAQFGAFGAPQGPLPPTVVISGVRESDQKKVTLTLTFNASQFQINDEVTVQGMLSEGEGVVFGPGMRSFQGKVRFKSAGQDQGAKVEGSVSGKLYEMRGGFGN